jgi:hypothetical protein
MLEEAAVHHHQVVAGSAAVGGSCHPLGRPVGLDRWVHPDRLFESGAVGGGS